MKKQTHVQWLYDQIGDTVPYEYAGQIASYLEEAMKMEAEQRKELSDEEIEKAASAYSAVNSINELALKYKYNDFVYAAKWYREQLKQKQ